MLPGAVSGKQYDALWFLSWYMLNIKLLMPCLNHIQNIIPVSICIENSKTTNINKTLNDVNRSDKNQMFLNFKENFVSNRAKVWIY